MQKLYQHFSFRVRVNQLRLDITGKTTHMGYYNIRWDRIDKDDDEYTKIIDRIIIGCIHKLFPVVNAIIIRDCGGYLNNAYKAENTVIAPVKNMRITNFIYQLQPNPKDFDGINIYLTNDNTVIIRYLKTPEYQMELSENLLDELFKSIISFMTYYTSFTKDIDIWLYEFDGLENHIMCLVKWLARNNYHTEFHE